MPKYSMIGRRSHSLKSFSPGPAKYNPKYQLKFVTITYGYSMGGRHKPKHKENSPGPGKYDSRPGLSKRSCKFGKEKNRTSLIHSETPGPAAYNTINNFYLPSKPNYSFGLKFKHCAKRATPGPGAYEFKGNIGNEGAKYTIVPRRNPINVSISISSPGPAIYNSLRPSSSPRYRIGTSLQRELYTNIEQIPGPGTYDPKYGNNSSRVSSANCRIGSAKRGSGRKLDKSPGPGEYEFKTKLGEGPKYKFGLRRAASMINKTPGPGQYNPHEVKLRQPNTVIGKESKDLLFKEVRLTPGPGTYKEAKRRDSNPAYSFGKSRRLSKRRSSNLPGPATYKTPCTFANVPHYILPNKKTEFAYV